MIDLRRYSAILFDFDGTLIDSWPGVYDAYVQGYQYFNPAGDISHIASLRNDNRKYEDAIKYVFKINVRNKIYEQKVAEIYLSEITEKAVIFGDVEKVIAYLKTIKKPWGIVTTKEQAFVEAIITKYPFLGTENLICSGHVTKKKPDPEGLLLAASCLKLVPHSILYVGDLESDIIASRRAGMSCACALYGYNDLREALLNWHANYYLNDITDLLPLGV